jgi:hypothetical protein
MSLRTTGPHWPSFGKPRSGPPLYSPNLQEFSQIRGNPAPAGNPEPSATDLAWLAGILDGEGHIGAWRNTKCRLPSIRIIFVNTNWWMIRQIKLLCWKITGRSNRAYERFDKGRHNRTWSVDITRRSSVEQILTALRPYVVAKTRQLEAALEVLAHRKRQSAEIDQRIMDLGEKIKFFNHHQPHPDCDEGVETIGETVETEEIVQAPIGP